MESRGDSPFSFENYKLYEILQVTPEATEADLKRAYRRLALQYHPDKNQNDPTSADKFRAVNRAHKLLSDPRKRKFYDRFGDSGLAFLSGKRPESATNTEAVFEFSDDDVNSWGANMALDVLTSPSKLIPVFLLVGSFFILALIQPILVDLNLTKVPSWNWFAVFTPLWILNLLILLLSIVPLIVTIKLKSKEPKEADAENHSETASFVSNIIGSLLLIMAAIALLLVQIFFIAKIQQSFTSTWTWQSIFLPYYVFEGLYAVYKLLALILLSRTDLFKEMTSSIKLMTLFQQLRWSFTRFTVVSLLILWLSDKTMIIYLNATFFTLYLTLFGFSVADYYWEKSVLRKAAAAGLTEEQIQALYSNFRVQTFMNGMLTVYLLVSFALLHSHLGGLPPHSWSVTFLPTMIMTGSSAFAFCCCLPLVTLCMEWALPAKGFAASPQSPFNDSPKDDTIIQMNVFGRANTSTTSLHQFGFGMAPYQHRITSSPHIS